MKKTLLMLFPLIFASLTLVLFLLLYHPAAASPGLTSASLVFLTALGWSAMIVCGHRRMRGLKAAYVAAALSASILLVLVFRPFPVEPLSHGLMVGFQALGSAGIAFYLRILRNKEGNPNE